MSKNGEIHWETKTENWGNERGKAIQKKIWRQKKNNEKVIQNDRGRGGPLLRNRRIKSCGTEKSYQKERMTGGKVEEKGMYRCGAVFNCRTLWVIYDVLFPTPEAG